MVPAQKKEVIVIIEADPVVRQGLLDLITQAGYEAFAAGEGAEGLSSARERSAELILLDASAAVPDCRGVVAELKGAASTQDTRIILLAAGGAPERTLCLDLGADDVVSRPWDSGELLARIRAQLRAKRQWEELRDKTRIAEEGQQIAHTAFEALAVTEKMTKDAFTLERALKIGVAAVFLIALVMAAIFFRFSRRASQETQRAYTAIARLEGSLARQQDLLADARKLREQMGQSPAGEHAGMERQLAETNELLRRVERESQSAEGIIRADASSVCLVHVSVGFRERESGRRLRYGGLNPQGEPIQDSEGNPVMTVEGRGPEVRAHIFGTGFLAGPGGLLLTNRHVAEPSWKDEEMNALSAQGIDAEIVIMEAYFPGVARGFPARIGKISSDADLAVLRVDWEELKRPALALDSGKAAAVSGQPVVSMGYATGLAAILARADEDTAQQVVRENSGDPDAVLRELARRNLIRPLVTQGHIGDVLADKIVFDAQTTSGGSGGPLFNRAGKVIGVTYAVVRGFGGSNFGIPIRYADSLLPRPRDR